MGLQRVTNFQLHILSGPGTIPTVLANKAYIEFVLIQQLALESLSVLQCHNPRLADARRIGVDHLPLQFQRQIFFGDARQISRRRVALGAASGPIKKRFALDRVPGQHSGQRIIALQMATLQSDACLMVKECGHFANLIGFHGGETGHAFINPAVVNYLGDQVAVDVVAYQWRSDEIWATRAFPIRPMAKRAV